jgi:hypothetical protein
VSAKITTKVAMPKDNFNWANNNAMDAQHAHLDKFLEQTISVPSQDQLVIAMNSSMPTTNAKDAQPVNSAKMEMPAKPSLNHVTETVKSN